MPRLHEIQTKIQSRQWANDVCQNRICSMEVKLQDLAWRSQTCIHYPLRRLSPPQPLSVLYPQVSGHVGGRGSATPGDQLANGCSREARRISASRRGRTSHDSSQAEENMTAIAIRTNIKSRDRSQFGEKPRHLLCNK